MTKFQKLLAEELIKFDDRFIPLLAKAKQDRPEDVAKLVIEKLKIEVPLNRLKAKVYFKMYGLKAILAIVAFILLYVLFNLIFSSFGRKKRPTTDYYLKARSLTIRSAANSASDKVGSLSFWDSEPAKVVEIDKKSGWAELENGGFIHSFYLEKDACFADKVNSIFPDKKTYAKGGHSYVYEGLVNYFDEYQLKGAFDDDNTLCNNCKWCDDRQAWYVASLMQAEDNVKGKNYVAIYYTEGNYRSLNEIISKQQEKKFNKQTTYPTNYALVISKANNPNDKKILVFEIDENEKSRLIKSIDRTLEDGEVLLLRSITKEQVENTEIRGFSPDSYFNDKEHLLKSIVVDKATAKAVQGKSAIHPF